MQVYNHIKFQFHPTSSIHSKMCLKSFNKIFPGLLEHVTVLIGIAVDKKAVAGVIHQPYYGYKIGNTCGRTIWGLTGLGAYGYTRSELPKDRRILTTTRSHSTGLVQEAVDSIKADEVIRVGGAGHKVIFILSLNKIRIPILNLPVK